MTPLPLARPSGRRYLLLVLLLFDLCPLRVHLSANCSHVTGAPQCPECPIPATAQRYLYIAFCKHLIFQLCRTIELRALPISLIA